VVYRTEVRVICNTLAKIILKPSQFYKFYDLICDKLAQVLI
jgi:hypothetical protein